jgi:hypothetical protein
VRLLALAGVPVTREAVEIRHAVRTEAASGNVRAAAFADEVVRAAGARSVLTATAPAAA